MIHMLVCYKHKISSFLNSRLNTLNSELWPSINNKRLCFSFNPYRAAASFISGIMIKLFFFINPPATGTPIDVPVPKKVSFIYPSSQLSSELIGVTSSRSHNLSSSFRTAGFIYVSSRFICPSTFAMVAT